MPVRPQGSTIVLTASASGITAELVVDTVDESFAIEPFNRVEFSNALLKNAPNSDGSTPLYLTGFGNLPIQVTSTCSSTDARPIIPDDANIDDIQKRFDIQRYTITGGPTQASELDKIQAVNEDHEIRLARFDNHIAESNANVSFTRLEELQTETFDFLTNTDTSISGVSVDGVVEEILVVDLTRSPEFEDVVNGETIIKSWSATIEVREIKALGDPS